MKQFIKAINIISQVKFFVATMIWLMILVVCGTIAQKDIGLYAAQQKYFSSWITNLWVFPVPGGRLTMLVLFINLTLFLLSSHLWKIKKVGILITHLGVLLLFIGGGLTAWFSSEGNMVIEEGSASNYVVDLYSNEIVVVNTSLDDHDLITSIGNNNLKKNKITEHRSIPFDIKILDYFVNCEPVRRDGDNYGFVGFAKNFELTEIKQNKEYSLNRSGVTFKVFNSGSDVVDGIYSLILNQPVTQTIAIDETEYILLLRRERTYLPFYIELNDFKKELYPGTTVAKSYSSDVNLVSDGVSRHVLIQMNEPLRHSGYTFYQSSFIEGQGKDATVLSAVKNYGRLFPYISSLIIALGLLIHIIVRLPGLIQTRNQEFKQ